MSTITGPLIHDIQDSLPRRSWQIGQRSGPPRFLTLHYNGPAVADRTPAGERAQLLADARYHMRPGALKSPKGGDGLQYHYAVGSDGAIYQCRDDMAVLWHCGHKTGNAQSLSVHIPIGEGQDATDEQWASTAQLFEWLRTHYAIPVERIIGHSEWGTKPSCPGPKLMRRLITWRQAAPATAIRKRGTVTRASAVYEAPSAASRIAMDGHALLDVGHIAVFDSIMVGKFALGDARWLHRADGLGFIPYGALDIALV